MKNQNDVLTARIQDSGIPESYAISRDVEMDGPSRDTPTNSYYQMPDNEKEQAMWENFDGNFEVEPSEDDLYQQKCEEFNCRVESYGLWGGLDAIPDDDMEDIEQLWQENEQDDLLSELLEQTGTHKFRETSAVPNFDNLNKIWMEEKKTMMMKYTEACPVTRPGFYIHQSLPFFWIQLIIYLGCTYQHLS
jgi:hypothetical protein